MLNIKKLLLGNFRVFAETSDIRLAPLTVLTGPNNSGKSSIAGSLSLMKSLDTNSLPFRLRFDNIDNSGGFESFVCKKSKNEKIQAGYELYNNILGENVKVELTFVKSGFFDATVKRYKVSHSAGVIFDFEFAENRMVTRIGTEYLYNKLIDISEKKSQFSELERNFRRIHSSSGHLQHDKSRNETGIGIFHVDGNAKRKNLNDYLKDQAMSAEEYERLSYFYGNQRELRECNEKHLINKGRKVINEFVYNDILFNNKLLKKILEIPVDSLDEHTLMAMIKKDFPDLFDCLILVSDTKLIGKIVSLLKLKIYKQWENEFLSCDITTTRLMKGNDSEKEFARAIEHHLQARFEISRFFRAITELSMTREGFNQAYGTFTNIKALSAFTTLVGEKILYDLKTDLDKAFMMGQPSRIEGPAIDFSHPLHELLRKYSMIRRKDTFLKNWIGKFGICDDISIDTPVEGMGYFPSIIRNKEYFPLSNESSAINKLLTIILSICNSKQYCNLRDFSDDLKNYPVTVIMDQPENGFHPSWQSKLADMLVDANHQLGLHFIIETHSEYIINKFQYLVASGKIDREDVVIYNFNNNEMAPVTEITIDQNGNLSREIPSSFIDEEDRRAMGLFRLKRISKN